MAIGARFRVGRVGAKGDVVAQFKAIERNFTSFVNHVRNVTPLIMIEALQPTYKKSHVYVPKDTGALDSSGYLEVTNTGRNPRVEMGYGKGGKPNYAVIVHEKVEYLHAEPTRAKYLQTAMLEDINEIRIRLITNFRRLTAGGSGGVR
jgi:hypothetical protein